MACNGDKRPWYKVKWRIWLLLSVALVTAALVYSITNKPLEISIGASGPTGQDKTLKQRIVFAGIIEKSFRKKGYLTTVQLQGEDGKTIKVYWPGLGLPLVEQMISNEQLITDFREMGFKKLVLWNHYNTWNVDLKN